MMKLPSLKVLAGLAFLVMLSIILVGVWHVWTSKGKLLPLQAPMESGALQATLQVNNARFADLPTEIPLFIKATFVNLSENEHVDLSAESGLQPIVNREDGQRVDTGWEMVSPGIGILLPQEQQSVYWTAIGSISPGSYVITLEGFWDSTNPAFLEITDKEAPPEQVSYHSRWVRLLKGEQDEVIGELKGILEEDSDTVLVRIQLAEALAFAGREEETRKQLGEVAYLIQEAQLESGGKIDIPDWIIFQLDGQD